MAFIKVKCPYHGSEKVVRYGKNSKGTQRYLFQNDTCSHKTFLLEYTKTAHEPGTREKIVEMAMNGAGTRDTSLNPFPLNAERLFKMTKKGRKNLCKKPPL